MFSKGICIQTRSLHEHFILDWHRLWFLNLAILVWLTDPSFLNWLFWNKNDNPELTSWTEKWPSYPGLTCWLDWPHHSNILTILEWPISLTRKLFVEFQCSRAIIIFLWFILHYHWVFLYSPFNSLNCLSPQICLNDHSLVLKILIFFFELILGLNYHY